MNDKKSQTCHLSNHQNLYFGKRRIACLFCVTRIDALLLCLQPQIEWQGRVMRGGCSVRNQCNGLKAAAVVAGGSAKCVIDRGRQGARVWRTSANDQRIELFASSSWRRPATTKTTTNVARRRVVSVLLLCACHFCVLHAHAYDDSWLVEKLFLLR